MFSVLKLYWLLFHPKTSGTKAAIECEEKFLLIRNTYGKRFWTFPGGGLQKNESPEKCVRREVKEELDISLGQIKKIGMYVSTRNYKIDTVYCFYTKVLSREFMIDRGEILEARWFGVDEIPTLYRSPGVDKLTAMLKAHQVGS